MQVEGLREDAVRLLREAYRRQGREQGMPWMVPKPAAHHAGLESGSRRYEEVVVYMEREGWIRPLHEEAKDIMGAPIYHITPEGLDVIRED